MKQRNFLRGITLIAILPAALAATTVNAHKLRAKGATVTVADANLAVTPSRDWNSLSQKVGKNTETWTLDGEQLNDVTFFGGIEADKPLVKERNKKKEPLPKFTKSTLLIEIPELLEGTYRAYKNMGSFQLLRTEPVKFLGQEGVSFSYQYTDTDELTRKGEARAAIIKGKLYMMTFDAPRLHYYDRIIEEFRALAANATLKS